jgi:hypothetical protein
VSPISSPSARARRPVIMANQRQVARNISGCPGQFGGVFQLCYKLLSLAQVRQIAFDLSEREERVAHIEPGLDHGFQDLL